jgi:hypothetical protein
MCARAHTGEGRPSINGVRVALDSIAGYLMADLRRFPSSRPSAPPPGRDRPLADKIQWMAIERPRVTAMVERFVDQYLDLFRENDDDAAAGR